MKFFQMLAVTIMANLIFSHSSFAFTSEPIVPELSENFNRISLFFTPKTMRLNAPLSREDLMKRGCTFEARFDFHKDKTILDRVRKIISTDKDEKSFLLRNMIVLHSIEGNTVELDFGEEENTDGLVFGILRKEGKDRHVPVSAPANLMDELRIWARKNATQKSFFKHCTD